MIWRLQATRAAPATAYPINDVYMELVRQGRGVLPADVSDYERLDVGPRERLRDAEARLSSP